MTNQTHTIRQQHWHIELQGSEADGWALQQQLADNYQTWLTPVLEKVLTTYAPKDGYWLIDRLDIDVGNVLLPRLNHDLPGLLAEALAKALQEQLPANPQTVTVNNQLAGQLQFKPGAVYLAEVFCYFLTTGSLPWHYQLPLGQNLEQALLASWQNTVIDSTDIIRVLKSDTARTRLIQQFSEPFRIFLLARLAPKLKDNIQAILTRLTETTLTVAELKSWQFQLWQTAFSAVAERQLPKLSDLITSSWQQFHGTAQNPALAGQFNQLWPELLLTATVKPDLANTAKLTNSLTTPLTQSTTPAQPNSTAPPNLALSPGKPQPAINRIVGHDTDELNQWPEQPDQHPDVYEGLYIENAGLVLLHPFLPQFFTALTISADGQLLNPERALCLLHYLSTGQPTAPEYQLILAKILCNVDLTMPVATNIALTTEELAEAEALLNAVIKHWSVLKSTGIDGLRHTFLLRPGKISLRDDGDWQLQVEHQSFDILLDQLPWGISMVKLPWMSRMLWVDWQH